MLGTRGRGSLLGVLDIGSSKIVCLAIEARRIARSADHGLVCLGAGHQRSDGMRGGVVADPAALEAAIRATVAQAERNSRQRLQEVYVSLSCGRVGSSSFAAHADIATGAVGTTDIDRVVSGARAFAERDGRMLVHMNRKAWRLDGVPAGDDPRGMAARRLSGDMHAVTADETAVRNLMHCVERSHLAVQGLVAAPYASALAVTTREERQLGVTVVDLGEGTTGFAVFAGGNFVHCELLATGGHHLTFEIAKNFQAPVVEAERIKTLYASMVNAQSDLGDRFSYALAADVDGGTGQASRADLFQVIEPRLSDLFGALAARRSALGVSGLPVVLTGGGSQLVGLEAYASAVLAAQVRLGRTAPLPGLPAGSDIPAFAGAVGLALAAIESTRVGIAGVGRSGYLSEFKRWIVGGM
jgi:cell division protein FtsA